MMATISQFHFLRPFWLLMLIPCVLIIIRLWRQHLTGSSWHKVIAPELLQHLLQEKQQQSSRLPLILLASGWFLACIALAGPSWQKLPVPVSKSQQPLVVVTDLSYYMLAADLKPNRLTRVRYKLQDLFRLRKDGVSAIVAYAGSAHAVAPLTDDSRTLANLVKAMSPEIMPVQGNNPEEGIRLARKLLAQGSNEAGDILLITGNMTSEQASVIQDELNSSGIKLSILGTGTDQGAPIPLPDGGYLKDQQGTIVVPQLDRTQLIALASGNGGLYRDISVNDSDLKTLLPASNINDDVIMVEREFDLWHDAGYWLLPFILALALAGFRRGWLMALAFTVLLPATPEARASGWQDLWQTSDQQGQAALQKSDNETAASLFKNPEWKGEALFRNQNFEQAAAEFAKTDTARGAYNQGNALAKAGKLQDALKAYDKALKKQPDMEDAEFNRKLVEDLLKQQEQQEQQNQDQQQNKDDKNQDQEDQQQQNQQQSDQSQDQQQSSDSESAEDQQQNSSQQESEQQKAEQKEAEQQEQEQEAAQQSEQEQSENQDEARQTRVEQDDSAQSPEKQAVESWLRTIPDDPGGLLRRKFMQQQQIRQQSGQGR